MAVGLLMAVTATALAVGLGLQNRSFEEGLDHWTAVTLNSNRDVVYGPGGGEGSEVPGCDAPDAYGICVVEGEDEFEVHDGNGTRTITVAPLDGSKMLRLAGPFHDSSENQAEEHIFHVSQQFVVDGAEPVVNLNYNMFTFDYSGFDELSLRVKISDDEGEIVNDFVQGGFGPSGDTSLKTTGWRGVEVDLSPYIGQQMSIQLEVVGTSDDLFGTWGYFDAGTAPTSPVDPGGSAGAAPAGVAVNKQVNENGLVSFTMANSEVTAALSGEDDCMPFKVSLPIDPGTSTLSNVTLNFNGQSEPMTLVGDLWEAILCVEPFEDGLLQLEYDATEDGVTQHFIVTVGEIVLIDPQGVVYDLATYNQARAGGQSEEQARATAAIVGATVRLQRETPAGSGQFLNVLSADPGIAPNVNPQITGADGRYQWDVSAGRYRVVVTKAGYTTATSAAVDIPPPVLDLHVPLSKPSSPTTGGQPAVTPPATSPASISSPPAGKPNKKNKKKKCSKKRKGKKGGKAKKCKRGKKAGKR